MSQENALCRHAEAYHSRSKQKRPGFFRKPGPPAVVAANTRTVEEVKSRRKNIAKWTMEERCQQHRQAFKTGYIGTVNPLFFEIGNVPLILTTDTGYLRGRAAGAAPG
jgi:hypothetical protein